MCNYRLDDYVSFDRDEFPQGSEFFSFDIETVVPVNKKGEVDKWVKDYKLKGATYSLLENAEEFSFKVFGFCLNSQDENFKQLILKLFEVLDKKSKIVYHCEDVQRTVFMWDGVVCPE